jgi:hypothetical protein
MLQEESKLKNNRLTFMHALRSRSETVPPQLIQLEKVALTAMVPRMPQLTYVTMERPAIITVTTTL